MQVAKKDDLEIVCSPAFTALPQARDVAIEPTEHSDRGSSSRKRSKSFLLPTRERRICELFAHRRNIACASHFETATGITAVFQVTKKLEAFGEWDAIYIKLTDPSVGRGPMQLVVSSISFHMT